MSPPRIRSGGHLDVNDVQAIVEIFTEPVRAHVGGEIAVRGGDEADVHVNGLVASDALEATFLQDAQELDLRGHRDLAYLVEEERPAVGLARSLAEATLVGAG